MSCTIRSRAWSHNSEKIKNCCKIIITYIWFGMNFEKIWKICDQARERYHPLESGIFSLSSGWNSLSPFQLKIDHKTKFNREMFLINVIRQIFHFPLSSGDPIAIANPIFQRVQNGWQLKMNEKICLIDHIFYIRAW